MPCETSQEDGQAALEPLVARARDGDRDALESVVRRVQGDVQALALRFLWHPQDAEDAAQEILIRIVTGLGGFRGDARFRTWVYRVACNALLTMRARRAEQQALGFAAFGEDLEQGLSDDALRVEPGYDEALLLEDVKIGCTLAMLLCLDREHRMALILGDIVGLEHREAAAVMEISRAAFRKRLSRGRRDIIAFMQAHCGLVNPANACRCRRRVNAAIDHGRVDPQRLLFASAPEQARRFPAVLSTIRRLEQARRAAALYRSHPEPKPSHAFRAWLREVLDATPLPR